MSIFGGKVDNEACSSASSAALRRCSSLWLADHGSASIPQCESSEKFKAAKTIEISDKNSFLSFDFCDPSAEFFLPTIPVGDPSTE
jgi:hypothetical protein